MSRITIGRVIGALAVLFALLAAPASAQKTWDGGGTSGNWSDALNWNADTLPSLSGGQTLEFSGTSQLVMNNDLTITGTLNGGNGALYFSNDGTAGKTGNFSLSGNSLNWGQTIYAKASTSTLLSDTVALNLVLVGATRNFRSGQNHSLTLSGTISQSGGNYAINLAGPEMLYITGTNNSFSGNLFVNNATTITKFGMANANSSIGTNAVIRFSPGFATQVNGAASSNEFWAALVYSGAGESTDKRGLMQTDGGWAPTVVPMQIRNNGSGALTFTSGTFLDPLNTWSYGFIPRVVAFTGSNSGGVNEIRGVIQDETAMAGSRVFGAYQVVKGGPNTWVLSGTNAYSGGSIINSGTLRAGSDRALGAASGALVINGGALDLGGRSLVVGSLTGNSGSVITSSSAGASSLTVSTAGPSTVIRTGQPNAALTGFAGSIQNGQGTVSLTKSGTGTLVLAGSNSYTGATTVTGGRLAVSFANFENVGAAGANAISSSSALSLGGGALELQGVVGGTNSQTFASLAVNSGAGGLVLSGSNALLLNVGAITRSPGGTLDITQPGGSLGATNGVITTTANAAGGILGGYATVAGADWAVANPGSGITAYQDYTYDDWGAVTNTTVTGDVSPASNATTNSLRFGDAGAFTVTLSGANTLTSGGLLVAPAVGANTSTITGGSLAGAAGADLVIVQSNTGGELVIASTVANNGGATGVTKSGAGKATLSSANTFTGTATVNAGTLVLSAANTAAASRINGGTLEYGNTGALGSGAVTFAGNGTLRAATAGTLTNAISVNANVTAGLESTDAAAVLGGVISGAGGIAKNGTGSLRLSANNSYTGMTTVNGGRLALSGSNVGSGGVTINSGTLALDFANATTGTNILTGTAQVGLAGGTLRLEGKASTNNAQTAILWLLGGDSKIDLSANTSNNLALSASTIMRDNRMGGTLDVTLPAGTQSGSNGLVINNVNTSRTDNTSGIISGFITVGGTTWAAWNAASSFITPFTAYSSNGAGGTSMNLDVTSSYALSTPGWNSMRFNTATAATVTLTGANNAGTGNVYFGGGAILVTANVGANESTISGGSMNGPSGGDFVIIQNNTAGGLTISSTLANTPNTTGLTKAGPGTLTLTAANTYNGVTNINGGTLVLGNSLAMQNSWLNTSGAGTLSFGGLTAATMQFISGTGNLALANSSSGAVTLTILGNGNNGAVNNGGFVQAALGTSPTYDGVLSGAGGVTLNESGDNFYGAELGLYSASAPPQAFNGANTYTGATTITKGILQVSTLANGGFASGVGASDNSASNLVLDGAGTGVQVSMLRYVGPAASTNRNFTINGTNAWIDASGYGPLVMSGTAAGTGTRRLVLTGSNQGDNTLSGNYAGSTFSMAKSGAGTWVLSGSNSFAGGVSVAAGTLGVGNANALGTGTASFTGNSTLRAGISGTLANRVDVASGVVATVDTQSYNLALSSTITGSGGLAKLGTGQLRLTNVNTYSGTTTVNAGRLLVDGSGNLANTARVVVNGSGAELKWNSSNALTAPLTVTQGTISGTGTINASGGVVIGTNAVIAPGNSPGIQSYTSGLTWASGGTYEWEINDWTGSAGTNYDQVAVTGGLLDITATSGSTFTIKIMSLTGANAAGAVDNFNGAASQTFTIATALSGGGVNGFDASKFTLDTSAFQPYNTYSGSFSISATGSTVLLNYTPGITTTSYTLSAAAGASAIHVGGTTSITATVTNTGTGAADSLAVTGLGVSVSPSGSVSLSPTSGTAANTNGTVVGSGNFTAATSGSYSFTPTVTSATNAVIGGAATATGTTTASVTAWNYAAANSISGTINFGTILAGGTFAGQSLSISNTAPNDGFSEKLDAAFGSPTGSASVSGSISLLAAGSTSTAMSIYLASGSAGAKLGSVPVNFTSNGVGTSGLGTTSLAPQTVSLSGTVLDPAVASFAAGPGATTLLLLDFGTVGQYSSPTPLGFDLYNLMQTSGYTADLALLTILTGTGNTGDITTTLATFNNLASGTFNPYTASLTTTNLGSFENSYTLQFKSANGGTVFEGDSTQSLTLTVRGVIVVPEPAAIVLAAGGVAIGLAGLRARRRRQRADADA